MAWGHDLLQVGLKSDCRTQKGVRRGIASILDYIVEKLVESNENGYVSEMVAKYTPSFNEIGLVEFTKYFVDRVEEINDELNRGDLFQLKIFTKTSTDSRGNLRIIRIDPGTNIMKALKIHLKIIDRIKNIL